METGKFQIIEMIGVCGKRIGLNGKHQTLELNLMRSEKGVPLFDLRWWEDSKPLYGIGLTERSLAELGELIDHYFEVV